MTASARSRNSPYLEAISSLAGVIKEHRASFDRDRRINDTVYDRLAEAGLFRLWLPVAVGGPQLTPHEFLIVVEAAAALDGSVGWLVGNGGGMSRAGGYLPEPVARAFYADPKAFIASSTAAVGKALPVEGGFRVTGKWFFASGAHHATWFMALCAPVNPDGKDGEPFCCYLPREQVTVHDTWNVSGLRGTGSCEFEVAEAFVPTKHTHSFLAPVPVQPGIVYRLPHVSVFAWTVASVPLGIARGAIEAFKEIATQKTRAGTSSVMREREIIQGLTGRVETLHAAARTLLAKAMTDLEEAATGTDMTALIQARLRLRTAATYAAETAVQIATMLTAEAGAISIFESSPLERAVRDIHAAAKHIAMSPSVYTTAGRVELGLDPGVPRF
jgi:alkylation response protein AidB-like acyl-CoA dehydrogenase